MLEFLALQLSKFLKLCVVGQSVSNPLLGMICNIHLDTSGSKNNHGQDIECDIHQFFGT